MTGGGYEINDLIEDIYSAGLDISAWQTVVDGLGARFPGAAISLQGHDFATNHHIGVLTCNFDPDAVRSFAHHYSNINPWMAGMASCPIGTTITTDAIMPREQLMRTAFYNDWLKPQDGMISGVGVTAYRDESTFMNLATNLRARDDERLKGPLIAGFDALGPHLRRSFALTRQLAGISIGEGYTATLELVPGAVFLIDRAGRLVHANTAGEQLLRPPSPIAVDRSGRLSLPAASYEAELQAIIDGDFAALNGGFTFTDAAGRKASATLSPFMPESRPRRDWLGLALGRHPVAILCMKVEHSRHEALTALGLEYRLTPAELRLAAALHDGLRLHEFATGAGLSIHTVRNQLRSVFEKTGVHRQSELMALLVRILGRADPPI